MDSSAFWPVSETGRWLAAMDLAAKLCARRRALGFDPNAVVAEVTGHYLKRPVTWNEAKLLCVEAVMDNRTTLSKSKNDR